MKTVTLLLNVGLALFTVGVLLTDGPPTEARFVAFSLLLFCVPAFSVYATWRSPGPSGPGLRAARTLAYCSNVILLAAVTWSFVTQFPSHPSEPGLIPFVVLTFAAPLATLFILWRGRRRLPPSSVAPS